jgi:hypothetical protein
MVDHVKHLDQRLNTLYELQENIRTAKLQGNQAAVKKNVEEGLAMSCILMGDMIDDENLTRMKGDTNARETLRRLSREGKLNAFLNLERTLLEITKLKPEVMEMLLGALRQVATSEGEVDSRLHDRVREFRDTVCKLVEARASSAHHVTLIRRVLVGGGGAMVALLNTFPPIPLPAFYAPISVGAGVWLLEKAMDGPVEDFIKGR